MRVNAFSVLFVLLLLLTGAAGYWLYQNVESYDVPNTDHFSAKAMRDPYLAADYFLRSLSLENPSAKKLRTPVKRESLLKQLHSLPQDGTVILTTPSNLLTEKQAAALLAWMQHGGHLLITAGNDSGSSPDPLLRQFGVSRKYDFFWLGKDALAEKKKPKLEDDESDTKKFSERLRELNKQIEAGALLNAEKNAEQADLTLVELEHNDAAIAVHFDPSFQLEHPAFKGDTDTTHKPEPIYWAKHDSRVHFAQFEVGKGLLTVVSDLDFWTSKEIGKHDHAELLAQLVDIHHGVSLISDVDMPPLPELIWFWARELIVAIGVLLIFGVWYRARRFGAIVDPQLHIRRALSEHIVASATYLWRSGNVDELLAAPRRTVLQRAQQVFVEFETLTAPQQVALLHSQTGLGENAIQRALYLAPATRQQHDHMRFRDAVITLRQLANQLHKLSS